MKIQRLLVLHCADYVYVCDVDVSDVPRFTVVIRIRQDMTVDVFKGECWMSNDTSRWVSEAECKLVCWSQLSSVLSHFVSYAKGSSLSVQEQVNLLDRALNELIGMTDDSDEYEPNVTSRLQFLREQISLLFKPHADTLQQ